MGHYITLHSCIAFMNQCQHMNKISVGILSTSNGKFDELLHLLSPWSGAKSFLSS